MDRHNSLSKSFVDRLTEPAIEALSGNARFVHPETGGTQWRFGKLRCVDGVDVLTVEDAGEAAELGDLLIVVAMADDSDAFVVRDDSNMTCMYWRHDDRSTEKLNFTLGQWLEEARRVDVGASLADEDIRMPPPALLLGRWHPQQVLTPGMKGHLKTVPGLEVLQDGQWVQHRRWPSKRTRENRIVALNEQEQWIDVRARVHERDEILRYFYGFDSRDRLILTGPDLNYKVAYVRHDS